MINARSLLQILINLCMILPWLAQEIRGQDAEILRRAKTEGSVHFYTSSSLSDMTHLADEFSKKYPFVKVDVYRAISERLHPKIVAEDRTGATRFDVLLCNTQQFEDLVARGLIGTYKSPERNAFAEKDKDSNGYWTNLQSSYYVLGYNTKLVPAVSVPKDWPDLLNPYWKGRFGLDSEEYIWYGGMVEYLGNETGKGFMRRLAAQSPVFRKGHNLITQLLVAGEFQAAIVYPNRVEQMKREGAPIDWVTTTKPIVTEMGQVGIAAKAPHPNAARLFVDFLLSREGQDVLRHAGRIVNRRDVAPLTPSLDASKLDLFRVSSNLVGRLNSIGKEFNETFKVQ
jgi:iron(III) transport system substrate-binding protein